MGIEAFGLRPSHPLCYAMLWLLSSSAAATELAGWDVVAKYRKLPKTTENNSHG